MIRYLLLLTLCLPAFASAVVIETPSVPPYAYVGENPDTVIIGESVSAIGEGAFAGSNVTKVIIPSSVTAIGAYAFSGCHHLESVELPDNLASIPEGCFLDCPALKEINIPKNITAIGDKAFAGSDVSVIDLSECRSLEKIGAWAFLDCKNLTEIYFPSGLTTVGTGAFMGCQSLVKCQLPESVTEIEDFTFTLTPSLDSQASLHDGITSVNRYSFSGAGHDSRMKLPENLQYIGDRAMERWTEMHTLDVSALNSVPELGDSVWAGVDASRVVLEVGDNMEREFAGASQWRDFNITMSATENFRTGNNGITISSNNGIIDITAPASVNRILVADISGLLLYDRSPESPFVSIDLSSRPTGIYLMRIEMADGTVENLKITK